MPTATPMEDEATTLDRKRYDRIAWVYDLLDSFMELVDIVEAKLWFDVVKRIEARSPITS